MKISGLDSLTRELDDAQKGLAELDGELSVVSFNPTDPQSIESAIQDVERIVDEKLGKYSKNAILGPLAIEMKNAYRQGIIDKAAEARLSGGDE